MKKYLAIFIVVLMIVTVVTVAACNQPSVRVILYVTEDGSPMIRNHVIGEDDLPTVTNGSMVFDGWYYDKTFNTPFKITDSIEDGQVLYAKWSTTGSTNGGKVKLTLNMGYSGSTPIVAELDKNSTYQLPTPNRSNYTFAGWFTESNGQGIKWTSSTPISADLTLYAYWTSGSGNTDPIDPTPVDLSAVFNKYKDISTWNFAVDYTTDDGNEQYEYLGYIISNSYLAADGNTYTDYLDMSNTMLYYYYSDNGDGTYTKYDENTDEFSEAYSYLSIVDLSVIGSYAFTENSGYYSAQNPSAAGNAVLGEYTGFTWNTFNVYITNGNISKLVGVMDDGYTMTYEFSKYGTINFTLPDATEGGSTGGGDGDPLPTEPTGTMENQVYNSDTFDNKNLQDKMEDSEDTIGLPSTGTYNALVIPVQFKGDTITQTQLNNLNIAFNGTSEQTGWESVKTYYEKSSYGKLNLTFDITEPYQSNNNATYYKNYSETVTVQGEQWTKDGSALILEEALAWCAAKNIDLSKYDTNNDGCIDAVYLIYSESVDYVDADFYWAYVTWYYGETQFDGIDAYYYLFAGFDFMTENLDKMSGVKVNAETYIHETGHLLGLDDYYDYDDTKGGNQGLGGADMMDYNVGDHGVYSKIMLGWLDPTIVTSTQTITIKSSQAEGYAILIPLNFNNSYFCEYLLIDLYSAQGLNAMGASQTNSILYNGAEYGVRIYHVTSWVTDPYNNSFGSFTDYNNSNSYIPLIKLVEADGQTSNSASGSWASEDDLWQAGDTFSNAFPQYMRNDGKTLNFDISIDSVSADSATVTITFNTAQA